MTVFELSLIPSAHVGKYSDYWEVLKPGGRIILDSKEAPLPVGWALIQGKIKGYQRGYQARIWIKTAQGENSCFLPVSAKGTIFEILRLPQGCQRLSLELQGRFQLEGFSLVPISPLRRLYLVYRRVIPFFGKKWRSQRHRVGLGWHHLIFPEVAYRLAAKIRNYNPDLDYGEWIQRFDVLTDMDRRLIRRQIRRWTVKPHFEILVFGGTLEERRRTEVSLRKQLYKAYRVTLERDGTVPEAWRRTLGRLPKSAFGLVLPAGVVLAEHALYWLAFEWLAHSETALIYADHDELEEGKRTAPAFKPDWSLELLRSTNYIGPVAAVRADVLADVIKNGGEQLDPHDLWLKAIERLGLNARCVRHIPAILWHIPKEKVRITVHPNPVQAHFDRLGVAAIAERTDRGHFRVHYHLLQNPPAVSIIVPTRNHHALLRACVESVLAKTNYPCFELFIVDNGSDDPQTLAYLGNLKKQHNVKVLRYPRPFNFSAINNFAVAHSKAPLICLLNNDTEVINSDWLAEMVGHVLQPGVGVVGAKLYFDDGRVQHAGDVVGPGGCADHLHVSLPRDEGGYMDRAILAQDLSAVTGACLLTWRYLYQSLGGLDEQHLPVAFNDVDYCLRVRERGLRVVFTPYAELYHRESSTRGRDRTPERQKRAQQEITYMRERWCWQMRHDPFYNPNLSYDHPDFTLSRHPRVDKPWRS